MEWVVAAVAFLALRTDVASASVTFWSASNPLIDGATLYAATLTSFVGPQPEDRFVHITGEMVVLSNVDLCNRATIPKDLVARRLVLASTDAVSAMSCSPETGYLNMYSSGALVLMLPIFGQTPSNSIYWHDGTKGARTRHLPMLCLQIEPSTDLYGALASGTAPVNVTAFPDENVFGPAFASWQYQVFVRAVPGACLIASGVFAVIFLVWHVAIINEDFYAEPGRRRTLRYWLAFIRARLRLAHAILAVEMFSSLLPGVILLVGGYQSTPNVSAPLLGYFTTLFGGWSFVASLASASVWFNKFHDILPGRQPSVISRIICGEYRSISVLLCLVPIILDTSMSVCFALYYYPPMLMIGASTTMFLLQFVVGSHVLLGLTQYYRTAHTIQSSVGGAAGHDASVDHLLRRLSWCALGMSLSMLMYCAGTAVMGISLDYVFTPTGFTLVWALINNGRALDSAFRTAMFRPGRRHPMSTSAGEVHARLVNVLSRFSK